MYAQIPPAEATDDWTDWRARLVARQPKLRPWLLRAAQWQRQAGLNLRYAREIFGELRADPEGGLRFWRAHQAEEAERLRLLADLRARIPAEDFDLAEVSATFARLVLKKDDAGMAEWFGDASRKLHEALARSEARGFPEPEFFGDALKELRFLSDMPAFYQRFALEALEPKVKTMYQALLSRLDALAALKKAEIAQAKDNHQIELARAEEAKLRAEQEKLAEENARVRELKAKLELEKERTAQKKLLMEAEAVRLRAEEDAARARAERERQDALQKDYLRMQEEERLKVAISQAATLDTQLESVSLALRAGRFDANDPMTRAKLQALREILASTIPG